MTRADGAEPACGRCWFGRAEEAGRPSTVLAADRETVAVGVDVAATGETRPPDTGHRDATDTGGRRRASAFGSRPSPGDDESAARIGRAPAGDVGDPSPGSGFMIQDPATPGKRSTQQNHPTFKSMPIPNPLSTSTCTHSLL